VLINAFAIEDADFIIASNCAAVKEANQHGRLLRICFVEWFVTQVMGSLGIHSYHLIREYRMQQVMQYDDR